MLQQNKRKITICSVLLCILIICNEFTVTSATTIKWTPGSSSSPTTSDNNDKETNFIETAATAPRSQRYWDDHNIKRPDYAKTDQEIRMEQRKKIQQLMKQQQQHPHQQYKNQNSIHSSITLMSFLCIFLSIVLIVGYHAEQRIPQANHRHRNGTHFGQFKSRLIWDQTRRPHATYVTWIRAILYELQPFRISTLNQYPWNTNIIIWRKTFYQTIKVLRYTGSLMLEGIIKIGTFIWNNWKWKDYSKYIILPLVYVALLVYLDRLLAAGPIIIIVTLLTLIFSIGLSDEKQNNNDGTSAYSVFNRGFQRLLGSVDVESLVAQHVGGGGMLAFQAQQQQQQQQQQQMVQERHNRQNQNREQMRAVAAVHENDEEGEEVNEGPPPPLQQQRRNESRKSGKKARRRNLEERRDRQRQRERARELGFVDGNDLNEGWMVDELNENENNIEVEMNQMHDDQQDAIVWEDENEF